MATKNTDPKQDEGNRTTEGASTLDSQTATASTTRDAALRTSADETADRRGQSAEEVAKRAQTLQGEQKNAPTPQINTAEQLSTVAAAAEAGARTAVERLVREVAQPTAGIAQQAKDGKLAELDPKELAAKARGLSAHQRLDETIPGGLTVHPGGYFQNAHGQEIDHEGTVLSEVPVNPNGVQGDYPRVDARVQPKVDQSVS